MPPSAAELLAASRPPSIEGAPELPRRVRFHPSPVDWRDEVLYFLLVDRFSDGREDTRPLLDRANPGAARGAQWSWQAWAASGGGRWQGGTLAGVRSKLGYLQRLGVTTLWLSPIFRQRAHLDTYHGYGVQDFLDVDPRFGTREELAALVADAHSRGMRILLDIIFNHSGHNWNYRRDAPGGAVTPWYTSGRHDFGSWLDGGGGETAEVNSDDDGVWPRELQQPDCYTRAGRGSLADNDLDDPQAQHKRTDFEDLRDFALDERNTLGNLAWCYKYWIALTDCDGFRIDTLKHVSFEQARNFCGTIKEFAANIGKENFFLVGEIAGGDENEDRYLNVLKRNLNAALDIGSMRMTLSAVGRGLTAPSAFFHGFDSAVADDLGSHRLAGNKHVSILDDHDLVFHEPGARLRFATRAPVAHQATVPLGLQLFTLGIPCVYYGTEQALGAPEESEWKWIPGFGESDAFLREAMFGPEHPRAAGRGAGFDAALPGFGPFGTAGQHVFDETHPVFERMARMTALRALLPVLRHGRQYARPVSTGGGPFLAAFAGGLAAWSRILDDEEAVIIANTNATASARGDVLVDASLNRSGGNMRIALHTGDATVVGRPVPLRDRDAVRFVTVEDLGPAEVLILVNKT
jgi:glycosidase